MLRSILENHFSSKFRKIWIYRTKKNTLQLVLFPVNTSENYRIVTRENFGKVDENTLIKLIETL